MGPALYTASCMHCLCVSGQSGGKALGAMWGEQKARQMLDEAGFASLEVKRSPLDPVNNYYIASKTGARDPGSSAGRRVAVPSGPRPSSVR